MTIQRYEKCGSVRLAATELEGYVSFKACVGVCG